MSVNNLILIVDDEESICRSLEGVLTDEGFKTKSVHSGELALKELEDYSPSVMLLDIWMPGLDGIETLKKIREKHPNVPVIMMSGHATVTTAIEALKIGAIDFIEKPIVLERIVEAVKAVSTNSKTKNFLSSLKKIEATEKDIGEYNSDVQIVNNSFGSQFWKGKPRPQKTLSSSALLYGQGLHTGKKSGLVLEPLPINSGIHFVGVGQTTAAPAHLDYVSSTGFATTISNGGTRASTIEHLMSACCAYGITNLLVKCNNEVPVMDGSSKEFCDLFRDIGIKEQGGSPVFDIAVPSTIRVEKSSDEFIQIEPADDLIIDYTLSYPNPVGVQKFTYKLDDSKNYEKEIALARTFGFVKDIGYLQQQGLALGGRFDNFVLIGDSGPINSKLRYEDEFVRHKILDAIGDLYLLGRRLSGKITAKMTGHSDNIALLREIVKAAGINNKKTS